MLQGKAAFWTDELQELQDQCEPHEVQGKMTIPAPGAE